MAYTAGDFLVRVQMTASSGLVEDVIVNDFAFRSSIGTDDAVVSSAMASISEFYRTDYTGVAVGKYLSERISRAATHRMSAYHIVAGPLGSPFYEEDWIGPPNPATANDNLPSEVAAVLSLHADYTGAVERSSTAESLPSTEAAIDQGAPLTHSGFPRPRARRRGRLYIGPLIANAVDTDADDPSLDAGFLTQLRTAAVALINATADPGGLPWSIWSRRDQALRTIVGGWTDNAPDTQRRRGFKSTSRSTFAA